MIQFNFTSSNDVIKSIKEWVTSGDDETLKSYVENMLQLLLSDKNRINLLTNELECYKAKVLHQNQRSWGYVINDKSIGIIVGLVYSNSIDIAKTKIAKKYNINTSDIEIFPIYTNYETTEFFNSNNS